MQTKKGRLHLEIQTSRKSPVGLLRSSRYSQGKTIHTQHGRITGCSLQQLKLLQLAFRDEVIPVDSKNAFQILDSKEYGASFCILEVMRQIGLDISLYSRKEPWVKSILAMIAGRIVYAGSKLALCNQSHNTMLWELSGITGKLDVEKNCYFPMDQLLSRQKKIQKKLAKQNMKEGHLVLYDITSSYLEGEYTKSDLVKFGYNRDRKKGHQQVVIGLLCNEEGCPVGVEVYPGNTKDETTVLDKIKEVREIYGVKKIIFVGDRGMVTKSNIEKIKEEKDLQTISALTRHEIINLLSREIIQPDFFDENNIHEIIDPDAPEKRYCLCKNPTSASKDSKTRTRLLELTLQGLEEIKGYKKKTTVEVLGARIGKLFAKYKMKKYIKWHVKADEKNSKSNQHQVIWSLDQDAIASSKLLDGCYIISTNVDKAELEKNKVVASYKSLGLVEQAFRNLKTVQLEMRPIYHKKDDRIRAHVFLCMLAYYVQWNLQKRLQPLFDKDSIGKNRRWTFENVIQTLKQITHNRCTVNGAQLFKISIPTAEQAEILSMLSVKL